MIPTISITKHLKIQKCYNGIKIFFNVNNKWYCLKIIDEKMDKLKFGIKMCE